MAETKKIPKIKAIEVFNVINTKRGLRTPEFIGYEDFKKILRGG